MQMYLTLLVAIVAVCAVAESRKDSLRRELAAAPTGWYATTLYTDAACTKPSGFYQATGYGMCVQVLDGTGQTTTSFVENGVVSGTTLTVTKTTYTDATCTNGAAVQPDGSILLTTCGLVDGTTDIWGYNKAQTGAFTAPAGTLVVTSYQTAALCASSPTTAYTGAQAFAVNTCIKAGSASRKVTASATGASMQDYSDTACATADGSPTAVTYTPACAANADVEDDNTMSFQTFSYTAAAAKSDDKAATCFASSETVQLQDGSIKALSEVQLGDMVLTAALDGSVNGFSAVIAVPHRGQEQTAATFVQLFTETSDVKMTPDHLVLAGSCAASAPLALVQARAVKTGDCLQTAAGKAAVTATKMVRGKGLASAVTQAGGLIVVNGITASPFAVSHRIGEAWYVIHRALYMVLPAALGWSLLQKTSEAFGDLAVQASL